MENEKHLEKSQEFEEHFGPLMELSGLATDFPFCPDKGTPCSTGQVFEKIISNDDDLLKMYGRLSEDGKNKLKEILAEINEKFQSPGRVVGLGEVKILSAKTIRKALPKIEKDDQKILRTQNLSEVSIEELSELFDNCQAHTLRDLGRKFSEIHKIKAAWLKKNKPSATRQRLADFMKNDVKSKGEKWLQNAKGDSLLSSFDRAVRDYKEELENLP